MRKSPARPPLSYLALAERGGFPARGLPFSLTLHLLVIGGALLLRFAPSFRFDTPTRRPPRTLAVVLPLESIQSPSAGQSGRPGITAPATTSHAVATRSMTASFAGPQQIIS